MNHVARVVILYGLWLAVCTSWAAGWELVPALLILSMFGAALYAVWPLLTKKEGE